MAPSPRKAEQTHLTRANLHQREAVPFSPHQDLEALFALRGRQRGGRQESNGTGAQTLEARTLLKLGRAARNKSADGYIQVEARPRIAASR